MLYYGSNTIQHAGVAASNSVYMHLFKMLPRGAPGPFGVLRVNREVYGVTGACVGVRRETFLEVGGLTEEPENFNDVDFSCNLGSRAPRADASALRALSL